MSASFRFASDTQLMPALWDGQTPPGLLDQGGLPATGLTDREYRCMGASRARQSSQLGEVERTLTTLPVSVCIKVLDRQGGSWKNSKAAPICL